MEQAVEQTRKLAQPLPNQENPDAFTADWLLTADHQLVLIEAGTPHTPKGGAHPCCFALLGKDLDVGPRPGRRLLENELGAMLYLPPEVEAAIAAYKAQEVDFDGASRRCAPPRSAWHRPS